MKNSTFSQKNPFPWAVLGAFALSLNTSNAATRTWNGATNTNYNDASNWSGNDVPDEDDSGVLAGAGTGISNLTGGVNPSTANALNIRSNHILNIDNDGGTLNVNNNVNMGRGLAGDGSTINHSAGVFSIGGLDMSGNPTGGTSFYNLSGTANLTLGSTRTFKVGGAVGVGDFDATFSITGDTATVTASGSAITLNSSAILNFELGATGIDAIDTTGLFTLQTGAELNIDGSSYTGGAGTIPLFSYGSRTDATEFTENITGFSDFNTNVVYGETGIDLELSHLASAPQVSSFTADNTQISVGDDVNLSWTTLNATSLTLDPGNMPVTGSGTTVAPTTHTIYTLRASNGVESNSEQLEILVGPRINSLTTDSPVITLLETAFLSWDVENAIELTLNPGGIDVTGLTTYEVLPDESTTYTLVASDGVTSVDEEIQVAVSPTIYSFSASPSRTTASDGSTLEWSVEGATSLTLNPGNIDVTGQTSEFVNITENTLYTLTASDGTFEDTAEVNVLLAADLPIITGSPIISVNFHANDASALSEHEVTSGESAGFIPIDGEFWTNINVGTSGPHNIAEQIFASTALIDSSGNTSAAIIAPSAESTYFVGYAASQASSETELQLPGNDDDLFNSYLGLNGPNGDGSPADLAVLNISDLSSDFTNNGYTVIVYSDSDRRDEGSNTRQSFYTLTPSGGSPLTAFVEDDDAEPGSNIFDGQYVFSDGVDDGSDYSNFVIFEGLSSSSFSLEITSSDGGRGAISGFQIVGGTGAIDTEPLLLCIENAPNGTDLNFSWDSLPGMTYTLRASTNLDSEPSTWSAVSGQVNLLATPPTNSVSITRPGDLKTFYVVEENAPN